MLVLTTKMDQSVNDIVIHADGHIVAILKVVSALGKIRLGIAAPKDIGIDRVCVYAKRYGMEPINEFKRTYKELE